MKKNSKPEKDEWYGCTREGHEHQQLLHFMNLTMEEKLEWLENAEKLAKTLLKQNKNK